MHTAMSNKPNTTRRRILVVLLLLGATGLAGVLVWLVLVAGLDLLFWNCMTKQDIALKTINDTSKSAGRFYHIQRRLPVSLAELPDGIPLDSWGRPIEYFPSDKGSYTLRSLGADGVKSGDDVCREFDAGDVSTMTSRPAD